MQEDSALILDDILISCIEEIWQNYDQDGNGLLDKQETKRFLLGTIAEMYGGSEAEADNMFSEYFSDEEFSNSFYKIDTDKSDTISKDEMLQFIKKIARFWWEIFGKWVFVNLYNDLLMNFIKEFN